MKATGSGRAIECGTTAVAPPDPLSFAFMVLVATPITGERTFHSWAIPIVVHLVRLFYYVLFCVENNQLTNYSTYLDVLHAAIDLLGYGFSDKPDPRNHPVNSIYNFETWSQQIQDFITEKINGQPTLVTCNSVGGIAGLQAAVDNPTLVPAVQIMNVSLRMLHVTKQPTWARPLISSLQTLLRTTPLGQLFFAQVATRQGVKNVLRQCYCNPDAVTDELVDCILSPGLEPNAVHVFLDFISYSGGPLPEELLSKVPVPVSVLWGAEDPWEKVEWGREFKNYAAVEEFIEFPGVGHCPMDEAPEVVNPSILQWIQRHAERT